MNAITKAKMRLLAREAFFAMVGLRLKVVEDYTQPTIWVDGISLGYNPDFFDPLTAEQQMGLLAHEICHVVLEHPWRRGGRNKEEWNEACDYVVNACLIKAGFDLPKNGLFDSSYENMSAEQVYAKRQKEKEKSQPNQQGNQQNNQQGNQDQGNSQQNQGNNPKPDPASSGSGGGKTGQDQNGQGQGGQNTPSRGEVRDCPEPQALQDAQQTLIQTKNACKAQGNLPGYMSEILEQTSPSPKDWYAELHRFAHQTDKSDFSWSRPNKRFIHQGIYLPTQRGDSLGELVIAIDTSASVDKKLLSKFCGTLSDVLSEGKPSKIHVIQVDTKVHKAEEFTACDLPLNINVVGRGGTRFPPAFAWVEEQNIKPECFIYFTDLECTHYPEEPDYPVMWVAPMGVHPYYKSLVPFGEVLEVE